MSHLPARGRAKFVNDLIRKEKKETPKQEKAESSAHQKMEKKLGVEKHCQKCGKEKCECK